MIAKRPAILPAIMLLVIVLSFVSAQTTTGTTSRYAPDIDALLMQNGYYANIIQVGDRRGLRASQLNYSNSVWTRDLDYAISGYSYVLDDMAVLRENIELFLARVDAEGIVPETIYVREGRLDAENRQSWDSMPNLIHAAYIYMAKTGDLGFYQQHRNTLLRVGEWIAGLDTNNDGLPNDAAFPFGYYDSVHNGVMHTYALAKFYAAYNELAELERFAGRDAVTWEQRAAGLRAGFHQSFNAGGYWPEGQDWPLAWRQPEGSVVDKLETFGVFAALRSGLVAPADGARYRQLVEALHLLLPEMLAGPVPMRLMLGGYDPHVRREVDPPVPLWMMDASAPWIVGLAAPAYAAMGYSQDAQTLMQSYAAMVGGTEPPVTEFAAGENACLGAGSTGDLGRSWDSAAWFMAVYGGHYGLTMTPGALVVQPRPFADVASDGVQNFYYQGATLQLSLDLPALTYRLQSDQPVNAVLRPMGSALRVRVNGGEAQDEVQVTLEPGQEYVAVSEGVQPVPMRPDVQLPPGGLYNCAAFRETWSRTDLPLAEEAPGLQPRTWVWGPQPLTGGLREPYAEGWRGTRLVQYYDKSRMEINNPAAPRDQWYVTNGLLVVEMITGQVQVGNDSFVDATPSEQVVAGDPAQDNPAAPTYRSFRSVAYPLNTERAADQRGQVVTTRLAKDGSTSDNPALVGYNVTIGSYSTELGHNVPQVFNDFFNQRGLVYQVGQYVNGQVIDPAFVVGLPISEPYWARVRVGGVEKDVLMQAFERRVLTYTPDNAPAWRVEMGNVGQHYRAWRYEK